MTLDARARAKWAVVAGGVLVHLVLGTVYSWGSLAVYVTSYLKTFSPEVTYNDTIVVYGCQIGAQACFMYLGGRLESRLGPRLTTFIGGLFIVGSTILASFVRSLSLMVLLYGVGFGMGVGLTYTTPLVCGYRWDDRKGLIAGYVVAGFGAGALVFNQIITAVVNPDNLKPTLKEGGNHYFTQGPVTDAVPGLFVKLGIIYAALFAGGIVLMRNPEPGYVSVNEQDVDVGVEDEGVGVQQVGLTTRLFDAEVNSLNSGRTSSQKSSELNLTPAQLVFTMRAWHVSMGLLLGAMGGLVTLGSYKRLGFQTWEDDDHFFSFVAGSFASVGNTFGRVFWGSASDRHGPYRALFMDYCMLAVLFLTWPLTTTVLKSEWLFALWLFGICFMHGGNFAIYPALCAQLFGQDRVGENFGLLFLPYGLFSLVGIALLPRIGAALEPLNFVLAGIALTALVSVLLLERAYDPRWRQA